MLSTNTASRHVFNRLLVASTAARRNLSSSTTTSPIRVVGTKNHLLSIPATSSNSSMVASVATPLPQQQQTQRTYSTVNSVAIAERVQRTLSAKSASALTYDEIASKIGLTNAYTVQIFLGQAKVSPETATKLQAVLPDITDQDLMAMQTDFPMRTFDNEILKEPNVYRTYEAITHYGEAIKALINEKCGDGIMSAIDFYLDVGTTTGKNGEKRVVITFNGKFLPHIEQKAADNNAKSPRD